MDWTSAVFPDFIAKSKASVCGDLHSAVATVHSHMFAVHGITQSWSHVQGLDIFGSAEEKTLDALQEKHRSAISHACCSECITAIGVRSIALVPGLHAQLCRLQYEKRGEGLEGFIT